MKYNDNGTIKEIKIKAICDVNVVNEKSNSTKDTYSCNYINKLDEHKINNTIPYVTTNGWQTVLNYNDYSEYNFITFHIKTNDNSFETTFTIPILVLKSISTSDAWSLRNNNKQYMNVGSSDNKLMVYKGYADVIKLILYK